MFASFRKCDLQVHSPRDPSWVGSRPLGRINGGATVSDLDIEHARTAWAESFIDACVAKGLQVVAVTDHHEMVLVEHVARALTARADSGSPVDLWLFPGMELTAQDGMQSIIVFDAELPPSWWVQAQGALGIEHAAIDTGAASARGLTQLAFPYNEIAKRLDAIAGLKGRYIVLPNVSEGGRHTTVITGHHQAFASMPYPGGYMDRGQTLHTSGTTHQKRLSGQEAIWGNRAIYPLPTSDAREEGFPNLGSNNAWIKLSAPTAESIKQAFLANQSRIRISEPSYPNIVVRSLAISGANPLADVVLEFSPELNTIIGGRGSGKSTVLEYLAFGLGRSCYDLQAKDYSGKDRLQALIRDTIIAENASVTIDVVQDGAPFQIMRGPISGYQPVLRFPNGKTQTMADKELRSLIPATAYSQGELSELGAAKGGTKMTDLLAFIDPSYKFEAEQLEQQILDAKVALEAAYKKLLELWRLNADRAKADNRAGALRARIAGLQATLPKLEPADQAVLDRHEQLIELSREVVRVEQVVLEIQEAFLEVTSLVTGIPDVETTASEPTFEAFRQHANTLLMNARKDQEGQSRVLVADRSKLTSAISAWNEEVAAHAKIRDAILEKVGAHKSVTTQIAERQGELAAETRRLQDFDRQIANAGNSVDAITVARSSLKALVAAQLERLREWGARIEDHSDQTIVVKIDESGDLSEVHNALEVLAARTRSVEAVRVRKFDELQARDAAWKVLDNAISETAQVLRWKLNGSDAKAIPQYTTVANLLGEGDTVGRAFLEHVDSDRLSTLVKAAPRARISLMYRSDGHEITFEKASEGQRAAALLMMLIKQGGGPLLVDQPEGDLDNSVVTKVVDLMHTMKHRRQIMFATHNANLVVNGAAELVVVMANNESGRRVVECNGAIDDTAINKRITATMEGGEQAFRDRQRKYGF